MFHERALQYAIHCIGVKESPDGSNRGPVQVSKPDGGVSFFQQHDFVAGEGYAWCVTFWLTCWATAGHVLPYLSPGAHAQGDWARKNGWAVPLGKLEPGDGCDWNEGSGHLSMFESYDEAKQVVHTIDGNYGNRVQRATHPATSLRTGIHVPEVHTIAPVKPPLWTVATSVNGHRQLLATKRATEAAFLKRILPPLVAKYGKAGLTVRRSK